MRYGDVLPTGFHIPSSAFWLKKDLTSANPFALLELKPGDRVMDCGAYIGTFAAAALEQGASHVACYEAASKTAVLLRENMARYGDAAEVIEGALVATDEKTVVLALSSFQGANSIVGAGPNAKAAVVKGINFRFEVLRILPQVIKIDIEGAEYDLLASLEPGDLSDVRAIFIEFHPALDQPAKIDRIRRFLESEGFYIHSSRRRAFIADRTRPDEGETLFGLEAE